MIGAGNVAWHLSHALKNASLEIVQVFSRRMNKAKELGLAIEAPFFSEIKKINPNTDLIILAIHDDAIHKVAHQIREIVGWETPIVHTSGATPSLDTSEGLEGIFYPLQTFSKNKAIDLHEVPMCIRGSSTKLEKELIELGEKISDHVTIISDHERAVLHVAAVFVNNFTNHLYSIGRDIVNEENLDFNLLHPLIKETVDKLKFSDPKEAQTGPAKRGDEETIKRHLDYLNDKKQWQNLYSLFSTLILKQTKKPKEN